MFGWLRAQSRAKKFNPRHSQVALVAIKTGRPSNVAARPVELFYKPRAFKTVAQFAVLAVILAWTIKNYIHVIATF